MREFCTSRPIIAADIGSKIAWHGPDGPIEEEPMKFERSTEPKLCAGCGEVLNASEFGKKATNFDGLKARCKACERAKAPMHYGRDTTKADIAVRRVDNFLAQGYNVVFEVTAPGTSQFPYLPLLELQSVEGPSRGKIFVIDSRAAKSYRLDHGLPKKADQAKSESDKLDAKIIYTIATTQPERVALWVGHREKLERNATSVRDFHMDEDEYHNEAADQFMRFLPPFAVLPGNLQGIFGNGAGNYNRANVIPLARALCPVHGEHTILQPHKLAGRRRRMERLFGMNGFGARSYYRNMYRRLYQHVARTKYGVDSPQIWSPVPDPERSWSQKIATNALRALFNLAMVHNGYPTA